MKKFYLISFLIMIICILSTGCTSVNETKEEQKDENNLTQSENYVGRWGTGRATLDVVNASDSYIFTINWATSAAEYSEWNYNCKYNNNTEKMDCVGSRVDKEFIDDDTEKSKAIYENGEANFSLKDNKIIWDDKEENMGEGLEFIK